jgi:hypothetical protein
MPEVVHPSVLFKDQFYKSIEYGETCLKKLDSLGDNEIKLKFIEMLLNFNIEMPVSKNNKIEIYFQTIYERNKLIYEFMNDVETKWKLFP